MVKTFAILSLYVWFNDNVLRFWKHETLTGCLYVASFPVWTLKIRYTSLIHDQMFGRTYRPQTRFLISQALMSRHLSSTARG